MKIPMAMVAQDVMIPIVGDGVHRHVHPNKPVRRLGRDAATEFATKRSKIACCVQSTVGEPTP
jgi:hypothetical protein